MKRRITTDKILENQIDRMITEQNKIKHYQNRTPQVGPRLKLFHYIYDEKIGMVAAIEKILNEFPELSVENLLDWYKEEEKRRERGNSDEGR